MSISVKVFDNAHGVAKSVITYRIIFDRYVSGFSLDDIIVNDAVIVELEGAGTTYTAYVVPDEGFKGDIILRINEDAAFDITGRMNAGYVSDNQPVDTTVGGVAYTYELISGRVVSQISADSNSGLILNLPEYNDEDLGVIYPEYDNFINFEEERIDVENFSIIPRGDFPDLNNLPSFDQWKLFAPNGFVGGVGGQGKVIASDGFQDITIADEPGAIMFDPSFNKGGDVIRFHGDPNSWYCVRSGSNVILSNGQTVAQIPVGIVGTTILFDDVAYVLRFDKASASVYMGGGFVGPSFQQVSITGETPPIPDGEAAEAMARLYLAEGANSTVGGNVNVIGTNGAENLTLLNGKIVFDPSFNQGDDRIVIDLPGSAFEVVRSGSSVTLDSETLDVTLPVGRIGMTVSFADADRELRYDADLGGIVFGSVLVGSSPVPLSDFA